MNDVYNMNCPNCPNHCAYPGMCTLGMEFFDRMKTLYDNRRKKNDETNKDDKQ